MISDVIEYQVNSLDVILNKKLAKIRAEERGIELWIKFIYI